MGVGYILYNAITLSVCAFTFDCNLCMNIDDGVRLVHMM